MRFIYTKQFVIFIALLAFAALLMFLHSFGEFAAVESAIAEVPRPIIYIFKGAGRGISGFFSYFTFVSDLNKTNASLKAQVTQLQEENALLEQYKLENNVLKQELDYRARTPFKLALANVIGSNAAGFGNSVVISAGTDEGVTAGDAVVAQGVFVGKIQEADSETSKVTLVTDPTSRIEAEISGTANNGILRGDYDSGIVLDMISQNAQIQKSQEVITFGSNNGIPSGILIGTIAGIKSSKTDLLQQATVLSSADLRNISLVDVIKK